MKKLALSAFLIAISQPSNAFSQYDKFNKTQKINSDFDKFVKGIKSQEYMLN